MNLLPVKLPACLLGIPCLLLFTACKKNKQSAAYTFSYSGDLYVADTIHFNSNAPSSAKFAWDFGDKSNSTVSAPGHVYTEAGTYTIALVINGDTAHTIRQTLVIAVDSSYDFTYSGSQYVGGTLYFSSKAVSGHKFSWNFYDGSTSTEANPKHVFTTAGIHEVSLTVNDQAARIIKKTAKIGIDSAIMASLTGTRLYNYTYDYTSQFFDTTYSVPNVAATITSPDPATISFDSYTMSFRSFKSGVVMFDLHPGSGYSDGCQLSYNTLTNKIFFTSHENTKVYSIGKTYETP
ncbi:MAG: hypothetical protein JWQ38_234 [Flavipsychrobacter sp.]|nr:hypothetical protein [Flavipsychrobacter sp.]